ncbi:hypothetical protein LOTGIDRAFT_176333 [Lottia gigantea]|uniref:Aminotransferase class V domain-containing protein n=1 Tax=Lottia gigantea TaxID=225164 RepID=V4CQ75_LOTGI|nr:hypothetical protein LOTGIDRAFT_176333 [Lottia gigantea]ESP04610.1 hypothetical protein LOTGIDRAFT_176333 [Lottia gigantea]
MALTHQQIELNLDELGADFFVGNLHKWLFAPRGCAILYVAKQHTDKIHALNSSWHLYEGLNAEFIDNGTKDHTPFFCAEASLNFFKSIGGFEKVYGYNKKLIREGSEYLMKLWGTDKQDIPETMEAPFMINVQLPRLKGVEVSGESTMKLQLDLLENQDITSVFITYLGVNYCRLSCQVYNTMDDFIKLGQAVKKLMI